MSYRLAASLRCYSTACINNLHNSYSSVHISHFNNLAKKKGFSCVLLFWGVIGAAIICLLQRLILILKVNNGRLCRDGDMVPFVTGYLCATISTVVHVHTYSVLVVTSL